MEMTTVGDILAADSGERDARGKPARNGTPFYAKGGRERREL
jgi:hypothetical protein